MLKKLAAIIVVAISFCATSQAQDPQFSQFYSAPMNLNPALAGVAYGPRFSLVYRNEWPKIDKGFVTYGLSYDQHIEKINSGIGVLFMYDRVANGLLNNYHLRINYAYQIRLARGVGMQIGMYGGYIGRSVNWAQFTFNDQIDPVFGFQNIQGLPNITTEPINSYDENINLFDAGAGFVVYSKMAYGGFAFSHINYPKEAFTDNADEFRLTVKSTIHAGLDINLSPKKRRSDNHLMPNMIFEAQGSSLALTGGSFVNLSKFYGGVFYRYNIGNSDAVIGLVGVKINVMRIGYSYDVTLSKLEISSGGAHEVTLSINLGAENGPLDPSRKTQRLDCPGALSF